MKISPNCFFILAPIMILLFHEEAWRSISHHQLFQLIFSTGNLLADVAIAIFAISLWSCDHETNKVRKYLLTLEMSKESMVASEIATDLRDAQGLEECLKSFAKSEDIGVLKKKMKRLVFYDNLRDLSIVLFIVGIIIQALGLTLQLYSLFFFG